VGVQVEPRTLSIKVAYCGKWVQWVHGSGKRSALTIASACEESSPASGRALAGATRIAEAPRLRLRCSASIRATSVSIACSVASENRPPLNRWLIVSAHSGGHVQTTHTHRGRKRGRGRGRERERATVVSDVCVCVCEENHHQARTERTYQDFRTCTILGRRCGFCQARNRDTPVL
jgi:hypothetical protein